MLCQRSVWSPEHLVAHTDLLRAGREGPTAARAELQQKRAVSVSFQLRGSGQSHKLAPGLAWHSCSAGPGPQDGAGPGTGAHALLSQPSCPGWGSPEGPAPPLGPAGTGPCGHAGAAVELPPARAVRSTCCTDIPRRQLEELCPSEPAHPLLC